MYGATSYLDGAVGDIVEEGTVVTDEQNRCRIGGKELLEPLD